ncbi:hypothetical protein BRC81_13905 [Halobacteriales archaeon QS_1_68_20]|nr:MAG: hypothetical protein BRC81_13905 [Halobacteriales archaeon QS_1_68_20]
MPGSVPAGTVRRRRRRPRWRRRRRSHRRGQSPWLRRRRPGTRSKPGVEPCTRPRPTAVRGRRRPGPRGGSHDTVPTWRSPARASPVPRRAAGWRCEPRP